MDCGCNALGFSLPCPGEVAWHVATRMSVLRGPQLDLARDSIGLAASEEAIGAQILKAVAKKQAKGGEAYASGKELVVFLDAGGAAWFPNRVARQLPEPMDFNAVWVVSLQGVESGEYRYAITRLIATNGDAPMWLVRIGKDFDSWNVAQIQ